MTPRTAKRALAVLVVAATAACTNHFSELFSQEGSAPGDASPPPVDAAADAGDAAVFAFEAGSPCPASAGPLPPLLPPIRGVTYHVATTGDDSASGTFERPWKTVQKAVDTLAPGETAFVHAGAYPDNVTWTRSGTADAPISLVGARAAPAVFSAIFQVKGQYLRVNGLVFDGTTRTGTLPLLAVRGGRDVEISGNEFRGAKGPAIAGFPDATATPDRARIVGNWIHDGAQGVAWQTGASALIGSNLFDDNSDVGISLDPSPQTTLVVSNTLVRQRIGILVGADSTSLVTGTRIVNNLITHQRELGIFVGTSASGNEARRNNFFANGTAAISGTITESENVLQTDPLYMAGRDLHLQSASTAIGAGDPMFTPAIDRDGRCRPIDLPDLGAFEQ